MEECKSYIRRFKINSCILISFKGKLVGIVQTKSCDDMLQKTLFCLRCNHGKCIGPCHWNLGPYALFQWHKNLKVDIFYALMGKSIPFMAIGKGSWSSNLGPCLSKAYVGKFNSESELHHIIKRYFLSQSPVCHVMAIDMHRTLQNSVTNSIHLFV